jgi:CubicO group peptidase (beta-lactamase class C family)
MPASLSDCGGRSEGRNAAAHDLPPVARFRAPARGVRHAWLLGLALMLGGAVLAQEPPLDEAVDGVPLDEVVADAPASGDAELGLFVDGLMRGILQREKLAGAVVSVVRGERLLLARGYGIDRIEPRREADPARSLFRIGSVSKTFTYVAAMQLVEQGLVGLDDPVDLHLPEALRPSADGFDAPIRVRHLLTHTAGFEDSALGHLFQREAEQVLSLDEYLQQHRPRRVRAPGTVAVYSNYGVALLGALVAKVRGAPFEDVIEQQLTGPLGMSRSTFREPLAAGDPRRIDPALATDISEGFKRRAGRFERQDFEYIAHGAPAGGVSASAVDMARWMRMLLRGGELDGVRVLSAENLRRMQSDRFANAPGTWPIGLGFLTERYGAVEAYGHGGATLQFHTGMVLLPAQDLGVFISVNTDAGRAAVRDAIRLILEHLAPELLPPPAPRIALEPEALQRFAGEYRSNRRPYHGAEKLVLALSTTRVEATAEGDLLLYLGREPLRLVPTAPNTFREAEGNTPAQFLLDASGQVSGLAYGFGISVLERVRWIERPATFYLALAVVAWVALARLLGAVRSGRRRHGPPARHGGNTIKALALLAALCWLALLGTGIVAGIGMAQMGNELLYAYPTPAFRAALTLATVCAALTALELLAVIPALRGQWRAWPKLRYSLGVLLLAGACLVFWQWNLIGMGF